MTPGTANDGPGTLHIAWGFDKPELIEAGIIWDELPMALHLAMEMPSLNGRTINYPNDQATEYLSE